MAHQVRENTLPNSDLRGRVLDRVQRRGVRHPAPFPVVGSDEQRPIRPGALPLKQGMDG